MYVYMYMYVYMCVYVLYVYVYMYMHVYMCICVYMYICICMCICIYICCATKSLQLCPFFAALWTVAHQAPLSMEFSRQEYWSGLPYPSPGDLLNPGIEPWSPALQGSALLSEPPGKPHINIYS